MMYSIKKIAPRKVHVFHVVSLVSRKGVPEMAPLLFIVFKHKLI